MLDATACDLLEEDEGHGVNRGAREGAELPGKRALAPAHADRPPGDEKKHGVKIDQDQPGGLRRIEPVVIDPEGARTKKTDEDVAPFIERLFQQALPEPDQKNVDGLGSEDEFVELDFALPGVFQWWHPHDSVPRAARASSTINAATRRPPQLPSALAD